MPSGFHGSQRSRPHCVVCSSLIISNLVRLSHATRWCGFLNLKCRTAFGRRPGYYSAPVRKLLNSDPLTTSRGTNLVALDIFKILFKLCLSTWLFRYICVAFCFSNRRCSLQNLFYGFPSGFSLFFSALSSFGGCGARLCLGFIFLAGTFMRLAHLSYRVSKRLRTLLYGVTAGTDIAQRAVCLTA